MTPGSEATRSDAELIAASLPAGEQFAALFDRHARTLHRYLARRAGVAAAEDPTAVVDRVGQRPAR